MKTLKEDDNRVIPYFANLASIGLLQAGRCTGDKRYIAAAKHWADWYAGHMNADGTVYDYTGRSGAWKSLDTFDSTDSYAGTYLELLDGLLTVERPWVTKRYASVPKAVAAIRLTLQPCGLTLAKPTWPVMYVMDNVETARGLRAAAHLAAQTGHAADAKAWTKVAVRMETAIEDKLWDAGRNVYLVGLQPDGGRMTGHGEWYPDVMASLMSISWGRPNARRKALYGRMVKRYGRNLPLTVKSEEDLELLVWWGLAARGTADKPRFRAIAARIAATDTKAVPVENPALLGSVCRILAP